MKVDIKPYEDSDKNSLLKMMATFNEMSGYAFDPLIRAKNIQEFTSNKSLGRLYVIRKDGQNIGYVALTFGYSFEYGGRDAFIDELFIKKKYRHQGIGRLAMDFIEAESQRLQVNTLHLEVEPHNTPAINLYKARGFENNDRTLMKKKVRSYKA